MTVTVKILRNERQRPADKLADAELHFSGEPLDGLKLIGFAIWAPSRRQRVLRHLPGASVQR